MHRLTLTIDFETQADRAAARKHVVDALYDAESEGEIEHPFNTRVEQSDRDEATPANADEATPANADEAFAEAMDDDRTITLSRRKMETLVSICIRSAREAMHPIQNSIVMEVLSPMYEQIPECFPQTYNAD